MMNEHQKKSHHFKGSPPKKENKSVTMFSWHRKRRKTGHRIPMSELHEDQRIGIGVP